MRRLFVVLLLSLLFAAAPAQPSTTIVGSWSDVSLCVDKATDRACKDETVFYRFRTDSGSSQRVVLDAFKIVGGDTVSMGTLTCEASAVQHTWECEINSPRYHGLWAFTVAGDALAGTLVDLPSRRLVRRAIAERVTP